MDHNDKKMFIIEYFILNERNKLRTHYTYANSRKSAEYNTRSMEYPDKINVVKIFPITCDDINTNEKLNTTLSNYKKYLETTIHNTEISI